MSHQEISHTTVSQLPSKKKTHTQKELENATVPGDIPPVGS